MVLNFRTLYLDKLAECMNKSLDVSPQAITRLSHVKLFGFEKIGKSYLPK